MVGAWRNFKNIFPRPLFIIIFRPEMLKFHPYSILTVDARVEFVIYCMLKQKLQHSSDCYFTRLKYLFGIGIWIWIWAAKNWRFSLRVSVVRVQDTFLNNSIHSGSYCSQIIYGTRRWLGDRSWLRQWCDRGITKMGWSPGYRSIFFRAWPKKFYIPNTNCFGIYFMSIY